VVIDAAAPIGSPAVAPARLAPQYAVIYTLSYPARQSRWKVAARLILALPELLVRLEATDDFPQRLREARPDIVFNIAEGLRGPNREAHVPAICEFYGIAYSGSDPFTLALCLDKARTKI